ACFAHDLFRPAYARRSIVPHARTMLGLRAGGKPVPIPDQVRDRLFRDHALMPLWLSDQPLVLASQSKVRRALLEAAGIPVEARPAHLDERAIEQQAGGAGPGEVAQTLAREKARTVAAMSENGIVVGCDQTLALGERRLDKPADRTAARAQLRAMRGRVHELYSAV